MTNHKNQMSGGKACGILLSMYIIAPTILYAVLRFGFAFTYFTWWQYVLIIFLFDLVLGMFRNVMRFS